MTTPTESPSVLLRRAADRLDELAGAATEGPWTSNRWHSDACKPECDDPACFRVLVGSLSATVGTTDVDRDPPEVFYVVGSRARHQGEADATYIATVDPPAGQAFAVMLRTEARNNAGDDDHTGCTPGACTTVAAINAARRILGEAS